MQDKYSQDANGFYKQEYFRQIDERLSKMEEKLDSIDSKMAYIYGFAAAVGVITSIVIQWVKSKF